MRVLLSAFQCVPGRGSELGKAWHWARALADAGHEVTVLTVTEHREAVQAADEPRIAFHFVDRRDTRIGGHSAGWRVAKSYLRWQDDAERAAAGLAGQHDLIHHVTWGSLHLGSRLWRLGTPFVYGPIGGGQVAPPGYWRYFGRHWPMERARTLATGSLLRWNGRSRETLKGAAMTLVTNSATAAAARRLGAADVRYMLSEGLPADWLAGPRAQPSGVPVVLWVGRMLPRKAPVLAVRAFAELRRTMPAVLVMAGDGPMLGQVRDAVARYRIAGDVVLLGSVPWAEVTSLYDSASVLLFTSLRDSSGAQFLEALGRGLPAVALDHHGIGDLDVGAAAVKVAVPGQPRALPGGLADALRTILDGGQWERRSAAGIGWARQWTWPVKADAATRLYREVLGR